MTNVGPQNHFLSCRKNKFFRLEVLSKTGQVLPPKVIRDKLEQIMEMAGGNCLRSNHFHDG